MPRVGLDKENIIQKAYDLANQKGFSYITMKNMAYELNVKTPSLYNHIESQDELYQELMIRGWNEIGTLLHEEYERNTGIDALYAMSRVFYHYAIEHPGVYQAMMFMNFYKDSRRTEISSQFFKDYFSLMKSLEFSDEMASHYLRAMRSFLDGFAALSFHESFGSKESVEESFEKSLHAILCGMLENRR